MPALPQTSVIDLHTDARRKVDEEIAELEARLVSLRVTRNALAPISRLHEEILQEIFALVHATSSPKGKASLCLSWVSHFWRELAHETSYLWSCMDIALPECIEAFLSRSKTREFEFSLDFQSDSDQRHLPALISLCLGSLPRTKLLKMTSKTLVVMQTVREWTIPVPNLVELTLKFVSIPPNIFSGNCPALQRLSITSCDVDWSTLPATPSLKRLAIGYPASRPSIDFIMQLLSRVASHLEELVLNYAFIPSASSTGIRLELPKLQLLMMDDGVHISIVRFLERVTLPNILQTKLYLTVWDEPGVAQALISARELTRWEIECLRITTEDGSTVICVTDSASGALPAPQTHFILDDHRANQDVDVLRFFGVLGSIQKLTVDAYVLRGFLGFIKDETDESTPFHKLKIWELVDNTLSRNGLFCEKAKELRQWLILKDRTGPRLEKLMITGMDPLHFDRLRGMFENVVDEFTFSNV